MSTTCSGCCASSRPRRSYVPGAGPPRRQAEDEIRRHLFRLDHALDARGAGRARGAGHPSRRAAPAGLPVRRRGGRLHPRATTRCSSSSRTAMRSCARSSINECGIDPARLVPVLHYDGTPITARFIIDEISASGSPRSRSRRSGRSRDDLSSKAQAASSLAADQRAGLHAARLRGLGLDALRRLRPRFDQRRDHPGLLRARPAAAPHRQAVGHRLLVEDARLFPRAGARLQLACTAACRRC